jgi:hypothetical protein
MGISEFQIALTAVVDGTAATEFVCCFGTTGGEFRRAASTTLKGEGHNHCLRLKRPPNPEAACSEAQIHHHFCFGRVGEAHAAALAVTPGRGAN